MNRISDSAATKPRPIRKTCEGRRNDLSGGATTNDLERGGILTPPRKRTLEGNAQLFHPQQLTISRSRPPRRHQRLRVPGRRDAPSAFLHLRLLLALLRRGERRRALDARRRPLARPTAGRRAGRMCCSRRRVGLDAARARSAAGGGVANGLEPAHGRHADVLVVRAAVRLLLRPRRPGRSRAVGDG